MEYRKYFKKTKRTRIPRPKSNYGKYLPNGWVDEYRFHPDRKWQFDFAWLDLKIAVEVNGSIWRKGGHNTGNGLTRDYEKLNHAQRSGWKVFQFTPDQVFNFDAYNFLCGAIGEAVGIDKICKMKNKTKINEETK